MCGKSRFPLCFLLIIVLLAVVLLPACQDGGDTVAVVGSDAASATAVSPTNTSTATATPILTNRPDPISTPSGIPIPPPTATAVVRQIVPLHFDHSTTTLSPDEINAQISEWLYEADPVDELSIAELTAVNTHNLTILTRAQAEADVDYLFRLFKHGYAGYGYFNRENAFEQAEAAILTVLATAFADKETVTRSWLSIEIQRHLTFIQDCHLRIGGGRYCQQSTYWYWDGIDFWEENGRFVFWQDGEQHWLESVNGESPADYLKLTLNRDGEPVYQLGLLADERPDDFLLGIRPLTSPAYQIADSWKTSSSMPTTSAIFTQYRQNDIPIIAMRQFLGNKADLQRFVDSAADLQEEPIIIVDIRGNGGGSDSWPREWVTTLTGKEPTYPFIVEALFTETALMGKINIFIAKGYDDSFIDSYRFTLDDISDTGRRWERVTGELPDFFTIPNRQQLIIVLVDKGVASSGESFLGFLQQVENVVFIGENSGGAVHFGAFGSYRLPNSGLPVTFGDKLFFLPNLHHIEGIGFEPDLWTPSDKALEYALAAIEKGWLHPLN